MASSKVNVLDGDHEVNLHAAEVHIEKDARKSSVNTIENDNLIVTMEAVVTVDDINLKEIHEDRETPEDK